MIGSFSLKINIYMPIKFSWYFNCRYVLEVSPFCWKVRSDFQLSFCIQSWVLFLVKHVSLMSKSRQESWFAASEASNRFRGLCSSFAPLECVLHYTEDSSDTCLGSRKGIQLMTAQYCLYSTYLVLPLSGDFKKKSWLLPFEFKAYLASRIWPSKYA